MAPLPLPHTFDGELQEQFDAVANAFPIDLSNIATAAKVFSASTTGLRVIFGGVTSAGANDFGAGFTPSKVATGRYKIVYGTAFASQPFSIAIPYGNLGGTGGQWGAGIDNQTTLDATQVGFAFTLAGTLTDNKFIFLAFGPK